MKQVKQLIGAAAALLLLVCNNSSKIFPMWLIRAPGRSLLRSPLSCQNEALAISRMLNSFPTHQAYSHVRVVPVLSVLKSILFRDGG